ncbi:hypothetical protein PanWU01x14_018710 [Parasponia andersonii]|uniref:Uncharacterized protein n=1 Tax=Parasponia andersonii TaxID=3476 RepID=A0A2P5DZB5_PARAD|nr:hypothetical protein PanWU01x14_018710 [Parasponia andersonii]
MKRQRNAEHTNSKVVPLKLEDSAGTGKKGKIRGGSVDKGKEEAVTAEEEVAAIAAGAVAESGVLGWEENWWQYWLIGGVVVDEQMSWGSVWLPFWDEEFMGEASSYSLFSDDVFWDDDIWGIRGGIKEIPPQP